MKERYIQIANALKHVQKRPGMYFTELMSPVDNFIGGFMLGVKFATDIEGTDDSYNKLLVKNKLVNNRSVIEQLQEQGYSESEAIDKYLSILIESFEST